MEHTHTKQRRGFTAIEIVLTLGTVALSAGMSIPMYRQYLIRNDLEVARQNIAQGLQRAKYLSQVAMHDSAWGYSTDAVPGRGVLFKGNSYATRDSTYDEAYSIPTTVAISGLTEVVFEKITGTPNNKGDFTLTALNGEQRTVTVTLGEEGNVTIPEDWFEICVDPYGSSPTTIEIPDSLWEVYEDDGALLGNCSAVSSSSSSTGPVCGNSTVETGEQCDGGGESATCDTDCTNASCGDGTVNSTAGEACDDSGESASCDSNCTAVSCGDGTLNTTAGEACDDGGESAACDSDCTTALCGDGTLNTTAGETCDDGGESASCDSNCTAVSCGDGTLNTTAGEECDDGNTTNGDGCDSSCNNEPVCGNGTVEGSEQCDDSNTTNGDGCDSSCNTEMCGNSLVQSGESCDDGGESATCDSNCTAVSCGDSTVNTTAGETCDDGGESASCDSNCTAVSCGDGTLNTTAGETCDDGGESASCDTDCTTAVCGDGTLNTTAGEACDDGNTTNGDGCDSSCAVETGTGPDFDIEDDEVTPTEEFTCTITVLGAAITAGGAYDKPVTMRFKFQNQWVEPFGDWALPVDSNLNDGNTHTYDCTQNYSAGTKINIQARDWSKRFSWYSGTSNSHFTNDTLVTSMGNNDNKLKTLVDGDPKPTESGFQNQASVEEFVEDYINFSTNTMEMESNEVIYLFELGSCASNCSTADFQDLVVLLQIKDPS